MLVAYDLHKSEKIWTDIAALAAAAICRRDIDEIEPGNIKYCKKVTSILVNGLIENNVQNNTALISAENDIVEFMPLRDLGMAAVPEDIILNPGKLTSSEYARIQRHTIEGEAFVNKLADDDESGVNKDILRNICLYHHENYDGSGYPKGISGTQIPIEARIASVVDCYEAMISPRRYRNAYSHDYVVKYMEGEIGRKFDPAVMEVFLLHKDEIGYIYDGSDFEYE